MSSLVSVVIPCYNHGKYLADALNSVLNQSVSPLEVIVVDDGSTDEATIKFLEEYHHDLVQIIRTTNQGPAKARNTGMSQAKGEYILPMDADDMIAPTFIEDTLVVLQKDETVGVVYTDQEWFGAETKTVTMHEFNFKEELVTNHVSTCVLMRRKAFEDVKAKNKLGYNPNMKYGYEDWDFWISVAEAGWKFAYLPKPLFKYRKSGPSVSTRAEAHHNELLGRLINNHSRSYVDNYPRTWIAKRLLKSVFAR